MKIITLIGCEVTKKLFKCVKEEYITPDRRKECGHSTELGPHCRHCGVIVKQTKNNYIPVIELTFDSNAYRDREATEYFIKDSHFRVLSTDSHDHGRHFIGVELITIDAEDDSGSLAVEDKYLEDYASVKSNLQALLSQYDLWDDNLFGLWTITQYN